MITEVLHESLETAADTFVSKPDMQKVRDIRSIALVNVNDVLRRHLSSYCSVGAACGCCTIQVSNRASKSSGMDHSCDEGNIMRDKRGKKKLTI